MPTWLEVAAIVLLQIWAIGWIMDRAFRQMHPDIYEGDDDDI